MARLLLQADGLPEEVIELRLGVNRLGRDPANDFRIEHSTVSARHCELTLTDDSILVRDCDSTNGTFIDGKRVHQAMLIAGQVLRLGSVTLYAEHTETRIAVPQFDTPRPAPPVVLEDGSVLCPRHPQALATHQCTHCHEVMCEACVHRLRRRGGKLLKLCPLCSHRCARIGGEKPKKKSFFGFLNQTVRIPFLTRSRGED
jgi:FHA domain